ncbi:MAG: TIGR00725 family protein [Solirubrobacteraceae bacterium]
MFPHPPYVAVIGPGEASPAQERAAEEIGAGLARAGAILVCGGHEGVMEAVCRGAAEAGGTAIGLLPGRERSEANRFVTIALPTGLGQLRNGLIVRAVDVVVAVGGAFGTLSEIALALKSGVPVIGLETWAIDGINTVASPIEAVAEALKRADLVRSGSPGVGSST